MAEPEKVGLHKLEGLGSGIWENALRPTEGIIQEYLRREICSRHPGVMAVIMTLPLD